MNLTDPTDRTDLPGLTHGYKRHLLPFAVAADAMRTGVQHRLAINEEPVMVMAVVQGDLEQPGAVRLAVHRMPRRVPAVEIANKLDLFGIGRDTDKIDRFGHFLGGIAVV